MKRFLFLAVLMLIFTAAAPALTYRKAVSDGLPVRAGETEEENITETAGTLSALSGETIAVFSPQSNKTETMPMETYIIGVVAAEMPAEYEIEALKAQALAALSYARYTAARSGQIRADSSTAQGYLTIEEMQETWGEQYEENYERIREAVEAVANLSLEYDGEPILAAYFAVSSGRTENAADIWGKEYPYLVTVASDGDTLSPAFESTVTVSAEELLQKLGAVRKINAPDDITDTVGDIETTENGSVTKAVICGTTFTGSEIRDALGLASAVFTIEEADGQFTFTVKGYGHGVGMSQYGADYMARQGADFAEILLHYYTGAQIVQKAMV